MGLGWLRSEQVTSDILAELIRDMHTSRHGIRWAVVVSVPPTVYGFLQTTSLVTQSICMAVWIVCILRIYVSETYVRDGSILQNHQAQRRWELRYAFAGVLYSCSLAALVADAILSGEGWFAAWVLAIVVGYSYSLIPFVALRPWIAWPQSTIGVVGAILALIWSGETVQLLTAGCLVIGLFSMLGHIRRHYITTLDALLARRTIEKIARTDHLTGLWNRRHFDHALALVIEQQPGQISLLAVDLDGFKRINDRLGHEAGDVVLKKAAERIRAACGPHAFIARVGGDEFAVLVPQGPMAASQTAWQIADAMRAPILVGDEVARIGASVGPAEILPGDTVDGVVRRADEAMYAAKTASRRAA